MAYGIITLSLVLASCGGKGSSLDYENGFQDGYSAGHNDGMNDGLAEGYNTGYQEGYNSGFSNGKEIGYDDGYIDGYEDGAGESGQGSFERPGKNIELHTDLQKSYIEDDPSKIGMYAHGYSGEELCKPKAVTLDWSDVKFAETCSTYTVVLSETSSFSDSVSYQSTEKSLDVYNLKLGTNYYWYVKATGSTMTFATPVFNFSTKNTVVRNLYVPNTSNWRDMGNYVLNNGKKIKQGLVYRSAAFGYYDGNVGTIAQATKDCILNELKIKTELDLNGSPNVPGLNKVSAVMKWEGINNLIDNEENKNSIKTVFNSLGDTSNYPAVFHCTRGRDRTGAIAFLLGAYLGMNAVDLHRDYLFTNFSAGNSCSIGAITGYEKYLAGYEGNTLQEQTTSYLKSIGVTEATLSTITSTLVA